MPQPRYRKPGRIHWPPNTDEVPWHQQALPHPDSDVWYQRIWRNAEAFAQQVAESTGDCLRPNQLGRATTKEVQWSHKSVAPVRPNRRGDIQSALDTSNLQHSRWTKQLRRLQYLTWCIHDQEVAVTMVEHRANLWRKICTAVGFQMGFASWWAAMPKKFIATPHLLPAALPTADQAQAIYLEFLAHYRALETSLSQAKVDHAIMRRAQDPNLIYRDVQREPAEPVQTLVAQHAVQVSTITNDTGGALLHLAEPLPEGFDAFTVNAVPVQVQHKAANEVYLPNAEVCREAQIHVSRLVGDAKSIIHQFNEEWAPRWHKPDHDLPGKWDTIVAFMQAALPQRRVEFPAITVDMWRKEARRKKKTAAVGPDGVSGNDMVNLPDAVIADLFSLITAVEQGAMWPTQVITGVVAALAKVPEATTTSQYRPITIFSLVYRIWSSIRSKQCLRYLLELVPHTLLGNMPKRSPKQMWYRIQEVVEFSHAMQQEAAGAVIDITKCFNALPRTPLLAIAEHIGIPLCVITPWRTALNMFQRRFQVRGATGAALSSNCGFPEGCGLSTVAMAVCNLTCELWMFYKSSSIRVWSFVDNIETVTETAEEACQSLDLLTQFCTLMDLTVDQVKSYCWANTVSGRQAIRGHAVSTKLYAKDLGGHMNYAKLRTNKTITQKISDLQPFWHRAARSSAPAAQKQRAILTAAWPNLFYGISTVTIGACHFDRLRTLATKALGATQAGVNPMLHLSCLLPAKLDPEFTVWCRQSLRTVRVTCLTSQH